MAGLIDINKATLEQAACAYASMGWPVLPLLPRKKEPHGKLVRTGLLEATDDLGRLRLWWEMWPNANIGLRTGIAFDVVDLDGPEALKSLSLVAPGYKHAGPVASTGRGYHLLFKTTGARNAANKLSSIDYRGINGYIVAPPSVHPNGHKYQWAKDGELPEAPEWLHQLTTPARSSEDYGERFEVEDIVPVFISLYSSIRELTPSGNLFKTNCIWHEDGTPSLYLYPHNNTFNCYGCSEWGDTLDLQQTFNEGGIAPSAWREIRKQRKVLG